MKRRILIVTVGRSEYSILRPVWRALEAAGADCGFVVAGGHLAPHQGMTEQALVADKAPVWGRVHCTLASDAPEAIAVSMGLAVAGFAQAFIAARGDMIVLLGDRHETLAAATAAAALPTPLAHIHGGEVTEGALDERFRHAITKLSHLHFASTPGAASRLRQLGEEPWRIAVTGAPGIDTLLSTSPLSPEEALKARGLEYHGPYLLVTLHPETIGDQTEVALAALVQALRIVDLPVVVTGSNADSGGRRINEVLQRFCEDMPRAQFITSFGADLFPSAMANALAVVGNSSSGLIEAPALGKGVVNIGARQQGRERSGHVMDVPADAEAVADVIRQAIRRDTVDRLAKTPGVYGDGQASARIAEVLMSTALDDRLLRKRFIDAPAAASVAASRE
jgi:UDP-hydrolysing UDP-N-acetyl-D-glucosamine 2-epimerase